GPNVVDANFTGSGFANTWYTGAQANRLSNLDQDPADDDIGAQFQSNVGTAGCLTTRSWYYGFDGNEGANGLDLLAVLLDRKSTRLNSSHVRISYAVFC